MKNRAGLLLTVIVILLVVAILPITAHAEPYGPTQTGELVVKTPGGGSSGGGSSPADEPVRPGARTSIAGSGFKPKAKYDILWDGKVIIDPYADNSGSISYSFNIPKNATPGLHTISVQGAAADGGTLVLSQSVRVAAARTVNSSSGGSDGDTGQGSFPYTGGDLLVGILGVGILLIITGFTAKVIRRTR